ncbi:MAG TPA: PAAR domain-containing protein [Bryobacteraceae bacterium]|jgi:uncharacterized Zn-binding protein involved in type VI secretion
MGLPAARLLDPTVLGGMITAPGCPTVLIGGQPAARITDLHTCPQNALYAPTGTPIILGSFTVLVGGLPQARQTDMLTCAPVPDMILMGFPTVLVGMVGGGAGFSGMSSGLSSG